MTSEFKPYQPIIPVETTLFLGHKAERWEWYPYPSRNYWDTGKGKQVKTLDKAETVISLARHHGLRGYLEEIDLAVGCRYPCQTCIRDSQALSSIMSLEAANEIIHSPSFSDLLPDYSVCVGFAAEPSDNPHVLEIMNSMLAATADKRDGFRISLKTNYRKQKEDILRELMTLTRSANRIVLIISLPLNRDNRIQDDFKEFKRNNAELFNDRVLIFDLKNPQWQEIEKFGRVLPGAKEAGLTEIETYQSRGKGGLLLNPEGLWLAVNTTRYEAHTPEIYTPVTVENASAIGNYIRRMNQVRVDFSQAKEHKMLAERIGNAFPPRIG